jgi:hypothetical protein
MTLTPYQARVASYLLDHCRAPGQAGGVRPGPLVEAVGGGDVQVARAVYELAELGLVGYDGKATTPFNNPDYLAGYFLTNVYLTPHRWETLTPGGLQDSTG